MLSKELIIKRLALIKYLHNMGVQQAYQVDTIAGFSVLAFHDCAEMFLLLAAENLGVKEYAKLSFMEFWNKIPALTLRESMNALKDRRVSIKHKGQFPSKSDIEFCRITITSFLKENTSLIFGLNYDEVRLSNLISYDKVKKYVEEAENEYEQGNYYESLVKSHIAFKELLIEYESSKRQPYSINSLLSIGEEVGTEYKSLVGNDIASGARWFDKITETTNKIREIVKIISLGIDFKKYTYFEAISPYIEIRWNKGEREYKSLPSSFYTERHTLRNEDCQFCINFVIDSALKLQEFDYDINSVFKT